jgi:hypothetical protein
MGCTPRPEYVLLRGLRRLHIFPGAAVGAQISSGASSASTRRSTDWTVQELVARWQPCAGVVDFHPLLDSLAQAGLVAAPEAISMWARALGSPNRCSAWIYRPSSAKSRIHAGMCRSGRKRVRCPPTSLATTGRRFHIASATPRPKPSWRLFLTTTVASRWSALTITAFACGSRRENCSRSMRLEPDPSWLERALVDTVLEAAELPVVAGISVQQVVDALGDPKERRAAADHRPVGVDSSVEPVGRDRAQQLGDPASHRRGVDHPHRAPAQRLAAVGERELQRAPAVLGDHRPKAPEGKGASGISCGPWAGAVIACR